MKSSKISFSGVMCALSFVLLYMSSVMWLFAYAAPIICALIIMSVNSTFGKKYALTVYVSCAILSILFLPDKEPALVYTFFFGYYPLIRESLEKIKPKALSFIAKLLIFNIGILSSQLVLIFVFGIKLDNDFGKWGIPLFVIMFNLMFLFYERLYPLALSLYETRIEKRIKNILRKQ